MLLHPGPGKELSPKTGWVVWAKKEGFLLNMESYVKLHSAEGNGSLRLCLASLLSPGKESHCRHDGGSKDMDLRPHAKKIK